MTMKAEGVSADENMRPTNVPFMDPATILRIAFKENGFSPDLIEATFYGGGYASPLTTASVVNGKMIKALESLMSCRVLTAIKHAYMDGDVKDSDIRQEEAHEYGIYMSFFDPSFQPTYTT